MSRHMIWRDDDHAAGWACSQCSWIVVAPPFSLDTTVATLAYNRAAHAAFEQHECVASAPRTKAAAHSAGAGT